MLACGKSRNNRTLYYHKGRRISSKKAQSIARRKKQNLQKICSRNNPITCTKSRNDRDMYFYQGRHISRKRLSVLSKRGRVIPKCLKKDYAVSKVEPLVDLDEMHEKDVMISQLQSENSYLEKKIDKLTSELDEEKRRSSERENEIVDIKTLQRENEKLTRQCKDCDMTKLKVIKGLQDKIENFEVREREITKTYDEEKKKWEEEKTIVQYVLNDCAEDRERARSCSSREGELIAQMNELKRLFEEERSLSNAIKKELEVLQNKCRESDSQLRSVERIENNLKEKDSVINDIINEVKAIPSSPPISSSNNVDSLLKAIEKGKDLRKVEIIKTEPSGDNLFKDILKGMKLKKVEKKKDEKIQDKDDKMKLLAQRRQFLQAVEDEDEWSTQYIRKRRNRQ